MRCYVLGCERGDTALVHVWADPPGFVDVCSDHRADALLYAARTVPSCDNRCCSRREAV